MYITYPKTTKLAKKQALQIKEMKQSMKDAAPTPPQPALQTAVQPEVQHIDPFSPSPQEYEEKIRAHLADNARLQAELDEGVAKLANWKLKVKEIITQNDGQLATLRGQLQTQQERTAAVEGEKKQMEARVVGWKAQVWRIRLNSHLL